MDKKIVVGETTRSRRSNRWMKLGLHKEKNRVPNCQADSRNQQNITKNHREIINQKVEDDEVDIRGRRLEDFTIGELL